MRPIRFLLVLAALAVATPAFAQEAPPAPAGHWPTMISDRPYTLDKGLIEIHGNMPITGAGGNTTALLGVGASFGLSDLIEIGGDYAFQLSPSTNAAGLFAGHVQIRLVHNMQMSAAIGASVFYSDSLSRDGVTLLAGGLSFRYRLSNELSLYTESNLCAGCINIAGPVMGQGLVAITSNETLAGFTVPGGIAYQASPTVYLYGATVLGAVILSPQTDSQWLFSDLIPVIAGGWLSVSPKLELGASITDDLKHSGDNYFFEFRARAFL